jgi:hypothetical protein
MTDTGMDLAADMLDSQVRAAAQGDAAEPERVFVDYHQFSVGEVAWADGPRQPEPGPMCLVFEPRHDETFVMTGIATGWVRVTCEALSSRPPVVADGWDDVAEVSLAVSEGPLRVTGWGSGPPSDVRLDAHGPGCYRIRIHARGRDADYDGSPEESVEEFVLLAWPEEHSRPAVLRKTSSAAEQELEM